MEYGQEFSALQNKELMGRNVTWLWVGVGRRQGVLLGCSHLLWILLLCVCVCVCVCVFYYNEVEIFT